MKQLILHLCLPEELCVGMGVAWRYAGAAVRTGVTQSRFGSLVVCGEALMGLILHQE